MKSLIPALPGTRAVYSYVEKGIKKIEILPVIAWASGEEDDGFVLQPVVYDGEGDDPGAAYLAESGVTTERRKCLKILMPGETFHDSPLPPF